MLASTRCKFTDLCGMNQTGNIIINQKIYNARSIYIIGQLERKHYYIVIVHKLIKGPKSSPAYHKIIIFLHTSEI